MMIIVDQTPNIVHNFTIFHKKTQYMRASKSIVHYLQIMCLFIGFV